MGATTLAAVTAPIAQFVAATAPPPSPPSLNPEWKPLGDTATDLQGIVVSAYPAHLVAMLLMVRFPQSPVTPPNDWIAHITPRITDATGHRDVCLNLALSAAGLEILGVKESVMTTFSRAFHEGMTTTNRAHFLGDQPDLWQWSDCAHNVNCIHAQLMIYALNEEKLERCVKSEVAVLESFGLIIAGRIFERINLGSDGQRHEHFGFADGISQPVLIDGGPPIRKRALHEIPAGEVVLGQINTYGDPSHGPLVPTSPSAAQTLKPAAREGFLDLGLNGTYLVIRQLKQDVAKFWNNMRIASVDLIDEAGREASDVWLAQKAMGRTLAGDMLTPGGSQGGNDMTFFAGDSEGFGCPITSHARRANPRDGLAPAKKDAQDLINANNRHRIMRRGRIYGEPIADRYTEDHVDRGLVFMCMNSEIERQFEFVQHTWLFNPMFGAGFNENDPILGPSCPFSIPGKPIRQQPTLETFITPVGGGYFFLPSLRALRYLGALA